MTSLALAAWGTQLKMDDGGGVNFTTVAEVTALSGFKMKSDLKDATSHDSAVAFHDKIPTLLDAGEITFTINYIPTNATHKNVAGGLIYTWENRLKRTFKLVMPDGATTWTCLGYVTMFDVKLNVDDKVTADCTITLTGMPTLQ